MKKVPTLFLRDEQNRKRVLPTLATERSLLDNAVPTRKYDGTACLIRAGILYKRCDAKHGKQPPPNFEPCEAAPDHITGHWPGWVPVGDGPADQWYREAWEVLPVDQRVDGTYELCGPKVSNNAEHLEKHVLIPHGKTVLPLGELPRDTEVLYVAVREFLTAIPIEGIVWWKDGVPVTKAKRKDFGLAWLLPKP